MDKLNRILKQSPKTHQESISAEILSLLRSFHALCIESNISLVKRQETKESMWNYSSRPCLKEDFEKYFSRAQELMPYGIIDELEEFLFSLTVGIKPKEKSLTSRLQEETVAQVLATYQDFIAIPYHDSYRTLCEEMHDSYLIGKSSRDGVSKESFDELVDVLSSV